MAVFRMKEHHGIDINVSAIRSITEFHAERAGNMEAAIAERMQSSSQMVLEMDGEMVPLVEHAESADRRKTKKNLWGELRIGVVQNHNEIDWGYACSFENPDYLGERLKPVMIKLGFTEKTKVHGVGDGALWIPEQGEKIAGTNYKHLIDLYHFSEYLSKAVSAWQEDTETEMKRLKTLAEEGRMREIQEE
jgi:hypothetical protein